MLGLDYGGTKIAVAVCDLTGDKLASAVVESRGEQGARASFDHGVQTARALLAQAAPDSTVAAVGVAYVLRGPANAGEATAVEGTPLHRGTGNQEAPVPASRRGPT